MLERSNRLLTDAVSGKIKIITKRGHETPGRFNHRLSALEPQMLEAAGTLTSHVALQHVRSPTTDVGSDKPRLLDQLREALRSRHYSRRTERSYCHWVRRFIYFHNVWHPAEMAETEINAFLTHLAVKEKVDKECVVRPMDSETVYTVCINPRRV